MPEQAVNVYRECGQLSFYASSPDRDPEWMLLVETPHWRIEEGELVIACAVPDALGNFVTGRTERLTPLQAVLAAKSGYFGLSVFRDATAAPRAVPEPAKPARRKPHHSWLCAVSDPHGKLVALQCLSLPTTDAAEARRHAEQAFKDAEYRDSRGEIRRINLAHLVVEREAKKPKPKEASG